MTVAKDNFYCSNNFLLLQLNSDGIDDDNIQSLGHGQCVVEQRELFALCKIPPLRRNFAWGAKYPMSYHPHGDTVEIVGVNSPINRRSCEEHRICGKVVIEDVVLHL